MTPAEVQELVDDLEAEINNGGFDQFFFNEAGDRAIQTIDALEAIGAHRTATIVRGACARFPEGTPPTDQDQRQGQLLESVSPEGDAFEADDAAFLEYEDDLAGLLAAYLDRQAG